MQASPQELYCSFCRRSQHQVDRLITQAGRQICNQCIRQFRSLIQQHNQLDHHHHHPNCGCSHAAEHPPAQPEESPQDP